jgi:hypothetical protein
MDLDIVVVVHHHVFGSHPCIRKDKRTNDPGVFVMNHLVMMDKLVGIVSGGDERVHLESSHLVVHLHKPWMTRLWREHRIRGYHEREMAVHVFRAVKTK